MAKLPRVIEDNLIKSLADIAVTTRAGIAATTRAVAGTGFSAIKSVAETPELITGDDIGVFTVEVPSSKGGSFEPHFVDIRVNRTGDATMECFRGAVCQFRFKRKPCKHIEEVAGALVGTTPTTMGPLWSQFSDLVAKRLGQESAVKTETAKAEISTDLVRTTRSFLLLGPTGSGKTHAIMKDLRQEQAEGRLSNIFLIQCSNGLEDVDLLRRTVPRSPADRVAELKALQQSNPGLAPATLALMVGEWGQTPGPLTQAFKAARTERVAIVLDELSRAGRTALNLVLKAMDPVLGKYVLQDFMAGETIEVPLDNILWCASSNMGAVYAGSDRLDEALLDRFEATVFVDYDINAEGAMLLDLGLAQSLVNKLQEVILSLRSAYKENRIASPLSTRLIRVWGEQISRGVDPIKAAQQVWVTRLVDKDDRGYPDEGQLQAIGIMLSPLG